MLAYSDEDVTTYIHIFVYHYGYFLHKFNGIEKFSNYALEGKHSEMKRILAHSTSRFSSGPAEAARQQLAALVRDELHNATLPPPTPTAKPSAQDWAQRHLPTHPTIAQFVNQTSFI